MGDDSCERQSFSRWPRTNWTLLLKSRSRLSIAILRALDSFDLPTLRVGDELMGLPPLLGLAATADSSLAIPAARSGESPGSSSNSSTPAAVVRLSGQSQGVVKRQGVSVKVEGEVSVSVLKRGQLFSRVKTCQLCVSRRTLSRTSEHLYCFRVLGSIRSGLGNQIRLPAVGDGKVP